MMAVLKKIDLEYAVSVVSKALSSKMDGKFGIITLRSEGDKLNLTTGNGDVVISVTTLASEVEDFKVGVPGRVFCEAIKKTLGDEIVIEIATEGLYLKSGDGYISVPTVEGDWTNYKKPVKANAITMDSAVFKQIIKNTVPFTASTPERPLLRGVNLKANDDIIIAAALDGTKLVKVEKNIDSFDGSIDVTIPANALTCIAAIVGDEEQVTLQVSKDENLLQIQTGEVQIIASLLAGEFISYEKVIPKEYTTRMLVCVKDFMQALEKVMVVSENYNMARLEIMPSKLEVSTKSDKGKAFSRVDVKTDGKDLNIAFNAKVLISTLKLITSDFITLQLNSSNQPATIVDDGTTYLFLPIRVS